MAEHSLGRLSWVAMILVAGQAFAGPPRLSQHLAHDQSAMVPIPESPAPAKAAVHLKLSTDIRQSIIHELVIPKGTSMLGTRYVLGANSSEAVDCSSLVQQMYRRAGVELPRVARDMVAVGQPVAMSALEPGDLLFYHWKKHHLHVVVYTGEGFVLHASTGNHEVVMRALNKTWRRHLVAARRIMQAQAARLILGAIRTSAYSFPLG